MARASIGAAFAAILFAACGEDASPPGPIGALSHIDADSHTVLTWHDAAAGEWLGAVAGLAPLWRALLGAPRGGAMGFRGVQPGDANLRSRLPPFVLATCFATPAAARAAAAAAIAEGSAEVDGSSVVVRPRGPGPAPGGPAIADEPWLAPTRAGLGAGEGGLTLLCDLRRLRRDLEAALGEEKARWLGQAPGLSSFLSVGVRLWPATDGDEDTGRLFVRLARMPVGLAKALDAEPAPLALPALFLGADEVEGWIVQRLEAQVLVDALQVLAGASMAGVLQTGPAELLGGMRGGVLFRRDFWRAFAAEWALVWWDTNEPCLLVGLNDREALLAALGELRGESSSMLQVATSERDGVVHADIRLLGQRFAGVVGRRFAALAPHAQRARLATFLEREAGDPATPVLPGVPAAVTGVGRLRLAGRELRWWVTRGAGGLLCTFRSSPPVRNG